MADRILEFLKNKYFIGAVVAVFLGFLINSITSYTKEKANEEEFKRFQEINNSLSSESTVNAEELNFEFDSDGFEIITKSVMAKKHLMNKIFLRLVNYLKMYLLRSKIVLLQRIQRKYFLNNTMKTW